MLLRCCCVVCCRVEVGLSVAVPDLKSFLVGGGDSAGEEGSVDVTDEAYASEEEDRMDNPDPPLTLVFRESRE